MELNKKKIIGAIILISLLILIASTIINSNEEEEWQEGNFTCKKAVMCMNNDCRYAEGNKICVENKLENEV